MASFLGLDFGTSSVKAVLVGPDGAVTGRSSAAYPTTTGPRGEAEQDPRQYLSAAREAIAGCGARGAALAGIGLAGQTPTVVLVDGAGEPVRPALTWQDHRADAEARELEQSLGDAGALFGTGLPWTAAYPPAKLLWLSRHEPASLSATRWVLQPKDYAGMALTGSPLSDPWSSKGLVHVRTLAPVPAILDLVGLGEAAAPPVAAGWEPRGMVTTRAAEAFGLPEGVPVSVGWSDALAAMLAAGVFEEPASFVLTGTSSIVGASSAVELPAHPSLLEIPSTCAPLTVHYGPTESSGASVDWVARLLDRTTAEALELAAREPPGSGPCFVPYISGERTPVWRTDVRGVFLGLSAAHGPAELARAVVDGVCLSEADVLDVAEGHLGVVAPEVRVAGRGASAAPWLAARQAALGRPLAILDDADASAIGAAMLGAASARDGDLRAVSEVRRGTRVFEPPPGDDGRNRELLERYRAAAAVSCAWADGAAVREDAVVT